MARDLTPAIITALGQAVIRPAILVDLDTASGHVRLWSGLGSFVWLGNTFTGVGKLGTISAIGETRDIRSQGIKLTLSGIPSDMISVALNDALPGLSVNVWIAMFTDPNGSPPTSTMIVDPYLAFSGLTDSIDLVDGGDTSTIEIAAESELIRLQQANETRYTHEDQQRRFPGDLGFEFQEQLQELNIPFGPIPNNVPLGVKLVSRPR